MSNFDESFFKDLLKEEREECLRGPGIDLELHEAFVAALSKGCEDQDALLAGVVDTAVRASLGL